MLEKRGMSHVEVILSFLLFITAVGFALYFFSPTNTDRLVDTALDYASREITKNTTVKMETYSIKIDGTTIEDSTKVIVISINGTCDNNYNSRIENLSGFVLPSKVGPGGSGETCDNSGQGQAENKDRLYIKNEAGWKDEDFIIIKLSEDFNPSPRESINQEGANPNNEEYKISSSTSEFVISEKRVLALNNSYYKDYFALKEYFNLPGRINFGFSLIFQDSNAIIAKRQIPSGLEVFSEIKRLQVLRNSTGNIEYADLTIAVW
ncbi:hypothetical protein HYV50_05680 [Candidatus Pacearchaeota archaeon]|nr:hypothetical protein [Candidatus Pacearchaeota archaeon]